VASDVALSRLIADALYLSAKAGYLSVLSSGRGVTLLPQSASNDLKVGGGRLVRVAA
jgi:hypothetical protein